ncbi:hypothetical protein RvY_14782 [Ramazzottius varieornatus]|uniref:Uncharacterized protein n=1 Tax=Ramazzottius varieornatus TaxID=947166 RepID=A0A1D1VW78_RAMVA|nr:hypothetical protein RvY_14782 [Ramazzottius varieornatus]
MLRALFFALYCWLVVECADLVHTNQVPCLGNGNSPFERNCIVPDLIDTAPTGAITVSFPAPFGLGFTLHLSRIFRRNSLLPFKDNIPGWKQGRIWK